MGKCITTSKNISIDPKTITSQQAVQVLLQAISSNKMPQRVVLLDPDVSTRSYHLVMGFLKIPSKTARLMQVTLSQPKNFSFLRLKQVKAVDSVLRAVEVLLTLLLSFSKRNTATSIVLTIDWSRHSRWRKPFLSYAQMTMNISRLSTRSLMEAT